ncbi:hypothetical protein PsYK624_042340 [Phanerochaete sordida]|uniref:DUF6593 domain-containing protein n=1 Tax=Phanerochaete sordida TaxID=48140 RepID=A0A9P3LA94_9APHY|nr:hypothetical protein PsYK624_042340 [Phanerochaete sordida]
MESQLTLIDIPELRLAGSSSLPAATTVLRFTRDCAHNTTITVSGQPWTHYAIHSDRYVTTTHITRVVQGSNPVSVGVVRRRSVLADRLTVGGVDAKLNQWLKMPLLQNLPATMHVRDASYTWRLISSSRVGIFADVKSSTTPIAWLDRSREEPVDGRYVSLLPSISLSEVAEELMDEIVLAVVILEHRLRMTDKARDTRVAAIGGAQGVPSISSQAKVLG